MVQSFFIDCGGYADRLQKILEIMLKAKHKNGEKIADLDNIKEADNILKFYKTVREMTKDTENPGKIISQSISEFEKIVQTGQDITNVEQIAIGVMKDCQRNESNSININRSANQETIDSNVEIKKEEEKKIPFYNKIDQILEESEKKEIEERMQNKNEDTLEDTRFKKTLSDAYYYMYTTEENNSNYSKAETLKHMLELVFENNNGYNKVALEMAREFGINEAIVSKDGKEEIAQMDQLLKLFNEETGEKLSIKEYKKIRENDDRIKYHHKAKTYEKRDTINDIIERTNERKIINKIRNAADLSIKKGNIDELVEYALNYPDKFNEVIKMTTDDYNKNQTEDLLAKAIKLSEAKEQAIEYQNDGIDLDKQRKMRAFIVLTTIQKNIEKTEKSDANLDMSKFILSKIAKLQYEQDEDCSEFALQLAKKYNMNELIESSENGERVVDIKGVLNILNAKNNSKITFEQYEDARENVVGRFMFFQKMNNMLKDGEKNKDEIIKSVKEDPEKTQALIEFEVAKANKESIKIDSETMQKLQLLSGILKTVKEEREQSSEVELQSVAQIRSAPSDDEYSL